MEICGWNFFFISRGDNSLFPCAYVSSSS